MVRILLLVFMVLSICGCGTRKSTLVHNQQSAQNDYVCVQTETHYVSQTNADTFRMDSYLENDLVDCEIIMEHSVSVSDISGATTTTTDRLLHRKKKSSSSLNTSTTMEASSLVTVDDSVQSKMEHHETLESDSIFNASEQGREDSRPLSVRLQSMVMNMVCGAILALLLYLLYKYRNHVYGKE